MKKPLKQALQEQIKAIQLDDQQLDQFMQMQQEADDNKDIQQPAAAYRPWYMAAAAMIMVLALGMVYLIQVQPTSSTTVQKIADEVAKNHLKMKPMEVHTSAISDVQQYFNNLDFLPQLSQVLGSDDDIYLAGGRYCSIQGSTAAQLRYKDQQGGYITLFETPYSPELFKQLPDIDKGEQPIVTYARGMKVTMWVEHGLLMVSTEKPE